MKLRPAGSFNYNGDGGGFTGTCPSCGGCMLGYEPPMVHVVSEVDIVEHGQPEAIVEAFFDLDQAKAYLKWLSDNNDKGWRMYHMSSYPIMEVEYGNGSE